MIFIVLVKENGPKNLNSTLSNKLYGSMPLQLGKMTKAWKQFIFFAEFNSES